MQLHLEDFLKIKERELKLYQRFLDLRRFCEETVFPLVDLPLKEHVNSLKGLIEKVIPDPRDRTEEMFSGEIFALLGTIYLHDIDLVKNYGWHTNEEIFNTLGIPDKRLLINYGIGKTLDIPEMAIEIINYLSFSNIVKKIPVEWEISEDSRRAIIRNTKVIGYIFNFSHLLHDIFCSDLRNLRLRRFQSPRLILRPDDATLDIDSREGVVHIGYRAKSPYEMHVLKKARQYVEDMFILFKNQVNGRHGFQYKEIVWDITSDYNYERDIFEVPKFSPYDQFQNPPFNRQEEAALILDKLFNLGHVVVAGEAAAGKTTVLKAFIIPQLLTVATNVFYCELWASPVSEIRDVVCKRHKSFNFTDLDIVSICSQLLSEGVCFFVIDGCERLTRLDASEREKFDRFVEFCLDQHNVYLLASGDSETFLDWYAPFERMTMAALYQLRLIDGAKATDAYGEENLFREVSRYYTPIECELLQANLNMERVLQDMLKGEKETVTAREILALLVDGTERHLRRYTVDDICFETSIDRDENLRCLAFLKEKDIVTESEFLGVCHYSLSSRYLRVPLDRILRLEEFDEKRKVRVILQNAIMNETFLESDALDLIDKWKGRMVFSKEAMGWILGSLILQGRGHAEIFEKARSDGGNIDIQPILKLIYLDDQSKRGAAIQLLIEIQDKNMINPLLVHLRNEDVLELKDLLVRGIGLTGKKKAIVAIMNTLKEIGDRDLKLRALDFFYGLFGKNAGKLLREIKEKEEDPVVLLTINNLLNALQETA